MVFPTPHWDDFQLIVRGLDFIFPYEELCIVCDRPRHIGWGDTGGLHSEGRMAMEYSDGYGVWALEGYQVPKELVLNPGSQTLSQIQAEQNIEIKRIRISRYGWQRYLQESEAKVLDVTLPNQGAWMESLMVCNGFRVLCTYDPSTKRPYALEVPEDCETCEQAQRYLLGRDSATRRLGLQGLKTETYPLLRT